MDTDNSEIASPEAPLKKRRGRQPKASVLAENPLRPEVRPVEQRPDLRDSDPIAAAEARAEQLRAMTQGDPDEGDKFYIDPRVIPPGWSYEWKRHKLLNAEDPSYQVELARKGWEAVPVSRHPDMMPIGYKGATIERFGNMLMERPKSITEEANRQELRKARAQVKGKEEQLSGVAQGQFGRDNKGDSLVKIHKDYEPIQIPKS